jgi:hypothetical protein
VPVSSLDGEQSYICVMDIDFSIGFWNWSDIVKCCFVFHFVAVSDYPFVIVLSLIKSVF